MIIEEINPLFIVIRVTFGFKEQPNIPAALAALGTQRWKFDVFSTSFFLSRRSLTPSANSGMPQWQDRLFIALARSADDVTEYFRIPSSRVVEIGTQIAI